MTTTEPNGVAECQYAQGDLMRAVQTIVQHNLPLTPEGAAECERRIRDVGEGNRTMWKHPEYLSLTISLAQGCVREARKGYRRETPR